MFEGGKETGFVLKETRMSRFASYLVMPLLLVASPLALAQTQTQTPAPSQTQTQTPAPSQTQGNDTGSSASMLQNTGKPAVVGKGKTGTESGSSPVAAKHVKHVRKVQPAAHHRRAGQAGANERRITAALNVMSAEGYTPTGKATVNGQHVDTSARKDGQTMNLQVDPNSRQVTQSD
jgi:hypothetical protein